MSNDRTRRDIVTGIGSGAAIVLAPSRLIAASPSESLAPATELAVRASRFLLTLDDTQRTAASFAWDGAEWRGWNYFGVGGYIKPGLRLEQMTAAQQDSAWAIFADVLSPAGIEKARTVMLLQDILAAAGNGTGQRSSKRFSVSVFGTPGDRGSWGLRLQGHHLSLSFAVRDGTVVSVTPSAFAALPNRVTSGAHAGLNTLRDEEAIARRLQLDLTPKLRVKAQIRDEHLYNIISSAGSERANAGKVGLAVSDMTTAQRDLLWQLVETFAVEPYAGAIAARQKMRVRSGDAAALHFAWYGPNTPEKSFGYRVIADTFVIELGCVDGAAQHIHPVYHDLGNVLGRVA